MTFAVLLLFFIAIAIILAIGSRNHRVLKRKHKKIMHECERMKKEIEKW